MTITELKNSYDSVIRQKTLPKSISTDNQADLLDSLADELLSRGVKQVANTTALSALTGSDHRNVIVENNGIYSWESSGTPNGTTIFAASGGGVWVLKMAIPKGALVSFNEQVPFAELYSYANVHTIIADLTFTPVIVIFVLFNIERSIK